MFLRGALYSTAIAAVFVSGLHADNGKGLENVVYVHSNNPIAGKNSVLGYNRNPQTGVVTPMPGSPFLTGGTGYFNTNERLGPDDTDQELVVTTDHRFLYVINQGSSTIAGFAIQSDGTLQTVPGSPFPAGGIRPGSLGLADRVLFVSNQGDQNPGGTGGTTPPNYASFRILGNGALLPLPWTEPVQTPGSTPTQALVSPDNKLLFNSNVFETPFNNTGFPPFIPAFSSVIHSYLIDARGQLIPASQTAPPSPIPPFVLGLQVHPSQKILYAGFVVAGAIGTYIYDDNGTMTLAGVAPGTPGGGMCWIAISPDAKNLYTADAITNQIDIFSIAADPLHPVFLGHVDLAGPKNPANFNETATLYDTTPFQLKTSPDGAFLYVVNHEESNLTGGNITGNALHVLKIGAGGLLTEIPSSPWIFPTAEVPMNAHPLGVLVF